MVDKSLFTHSSSLSQTINGPFTERKSCRLILSQQERIYLSEVDSTVRQLRNVRRSFLYPMIQLARALYNDFVGVYQTNNMQAKIKCFSQSIKHDFKNISTANNSVAGPRNWLVKNKFGKRNKSKHSRKTTTNEKIAFALKENLFSSYLLRKFPRSASKNGIVKVAKVNENIGTRLNHLEGK